MIGESSQQDSRNKWEMISRVWIKRLIIVLILGYLIAISIRILRQPDHFQQDFRSYYYAADAYSRGLNPYDLNQISKIHEDAIYSYCYPPYTLIFLRVLSAFDYVTSYRIFLILKLIILIFLIILWERGFLKTRLDLPLYILCIFVFHSTIYRDLIAGNISIIEQCLLWFSFYLFTKRKLLGFCVLVIAAASFKIIFIPFVLLVLTLERKEKYLYLLFSGLGFIILHLVTYLFYPVMYAGFVRNIEGLEAGMINLSSFDLVITGFRQFNQRTGIVISPLFQWGVYFLVIMIIILFILKAFRILLRIKYDEKEYIFIYLACIGYILILPFVMGYAYIILIVPTYFIIKKVENKKLWVALFGIILISSFLPGLPGFGVIFMALSKYSPLFLAYGVLMLYLYWIYSMKKSTPIYDS